MRLSRRLLPSFSKLQALRKCPCQTMVAVVSLQLPLWGLCCWQCDWMRCLVGQLPEELFSVPHEVPPQGTTFAIGLLISRTCHLCWWHQWNWQIIIEFECHGHWRKPGFGSQWHAYRSALSWKTWRLPSSWLGARREMPTEPRQSCATRGCPDLKELPRVPNIVGCSKSLRSTSTIMNTSFGSCCT